MKKIIFILLLLPAVLISQSLIKVNQKSILLDTTRPHQNNIPMYITAAGGFSLNGIVLISFSMEPILFKHLLLRTGVDIIIARSSDERASLHFIPTYSIYEGSSFLFGLGVTYYPKSKLFAPTGSIRGNFEMSAGTYGGCELRYPVAIGSGAISLPQLFIHISFDPLKKE
jgi:hypothetical protein